MRVLVADDHHLIREGLARALAGTPGIAEVGEAGHGQEALDMVMTGAWDVLILDINLPGKSGFDVLAELRHHEPTIPVLILSMHPAMTFGVRALRAGAAGYLAKTSPTAELIKAVFRVAAGGKYVSEDVADQLAEHVARPSELPSHELLSEREFQVFLLIGEGKTVGEIARALHLHVKTISTHRTHILAKMHLVNNAQIMQYVLTHDLLP